jgi:5-methylcytosine-specific restriction endonuclease McrA
MAAREYTCAACGVVRLSGTRGRLPSLCEGCKKPNPAQRRSVVRRKKPSGRHRPRAHICELCGGEFWSQQRASRWHRTCAVLVRMAAAREQREGRSCRVWFGRCEECERPFASNQPSRKTCSASCARIRANRVVAAKKRAAYFSLSVVTPCRECGAQLPYRHGAAKYCSTKCMNRAVKRSGRHRRRARLKGGEHFTALEVFEADGWRCYLCGRATPRRLMGNVRNGRAPTLDHVVALARGGTHSRANVRCACRSCNSLKGDAVTGAGLDLGAVRAIDRAPPHAGIKSPRLIPNDSV